MFSYTNYSRKKNRISSICILVFLLLLLSSCDYSNKTLEIRNCNVNHGDYVLVDGLNNVQGFQTIESFKIDLMLSIKEIKLRNSSVSELPDFEIIENRSIYNLSTKLLSDICSNGSFGGHNQILLGPAPKLTIEFEDSSTSVLMEFYQNTESEIDKLIVYYSDTTYDREQVVFIEEYIQYFDDLDDILTKLD
jgi:hypothetical protein